MTAQPTTAFTTAYANRFARIHRPLLDRINALDGDTLTPVTLAALRVALTRLQTHLQRRTTRADVIASCQEAEAILTDLRRALDAMKGDGR
jgi:hypothetical protein